MITALGNPALCIRVTKAAMKKVSTFSEVVATIAMRNFQTSCMDQCMERP